MAQIQEWAKMLEFSGKNVRILHYNHLIEVVSSRLSFLNLFLINSLLLLWVMNCFCFKCCLKIVSLTFQYLLCVILPSNVG